MYLDQRMKKYLKIFGLIAFVVILAGCTANLDKSGKLIASRAIDESTKWSLSAGVFDFILTIPIAKGILLISKFGGVVTGVVGMTIFVNILILPFMIKSTVSSQKMQMIQPEVEKIQLKYRGRNDQASQMRQSAELQALYKKNDISMLGSFATFLTLPIMLAMWQSVQRLSVIYDSTLLGLNLGNVPMSMITSGHVQYLIIVLIVGFTQFFAIQINQIMLKRNPRYRPSAQQKQMNSMNYFMTVMIVWFALSMPTAMSLYWITTNIITIIRTVYIQLYHVEKK
jgi:YidC/Oxa1 family membrane protein insertase